MNLFGSGFEVILAAITKSVLGFSGDPIAFENAMTFGTALRLEQSEATSAAAPPSFVNAGGCSGNACKMVHSSKLGFPHGLLPGMFSPSQVDSTSVSA